MMEGKKYTKILDQLENKNPIEPDLSQPGNNNNCPFETVGDRAVQIVEALEKNVQKALKWNQNINIKLEKESQGYESGTRNLLGDKERRIEVKDIVERKVEDAGLIDQRPFESTKKNTAEIVEEAKQNETFAKKNKILFETLSNPKIIYWSILGLSCIAGGCYYLSYLYNNNTKGDELPPNDVIQHPNISQGTTTTEYEFFGYKPIKYIVKTVTKYND